MSRARVRPRLIAITDLSVAPAELLVARLGGLVASAAPGSVMLQLRDRALPIRERALLGERLARVARASGQLFAVNDRVDLAMLLGADAVHLGEASMDADAARRLAGPELFVSRAVHEPSAPALGADALVLSPIAAPRKGRPALGVAALSARSDALVYALGGVDAATARACLDAGATGVAVIGAVLDGRPVEPLLDALGIRR
ncbi:MAG: thiamine phosphate synthase [Sorangiineae bacterium]|nr:thiamine phosphate synthase [Polyangiaceae bacterium]MEB2323966.1 thiamine phosphate synthase [Sorangiineae bacterium]